MSLTVPWALDDGRIINLVTPEGFDLLPDGTTLISINGEIVVKGTDDIDDDTRFGYMAFGFLEASNEEE